MTAFENLVSTLVQAKIPSPRLEARLLLAKVLQKDSQDTALLSAELSEKQESLLHDLVIRRTQKHEPLDKIIGTKGFYKYDFAVNENVLSPRPDTEILLEEALNLSQNKQVSILDLGTGSGCILLSLLKENPQALGVGVDISDKALQVARQNAKNLGVEMQVVWKNLSWDEDDFLAQLQDEFDIIVSNPPYIADEEIPFLEPEVKNYDPILALSGGKDGYVAYRRLAELTPKLLKKGGYLLLECGINQARQVADIFMKEGLSLCKIAKDLQNIERCVILKK